MGGFNSKEFSEMVEEEDAASTPQGKKLPVDPRSPTDMFARTPIQVEKTPDVMDPRSPSDCITRTPLQVEKTPDVLDPRSPSDCITRTPLGVESHLIDPRSPAVEFSRTPINGESVMVDPRSPAVQFIRTPLMVLDDLPNKKGTSAPLPLDLSLTDSPATTKRDTAELTKSTESSSKLNRSYSDSDLTKENASLIRPSTERRSSSAKKSTTNGLKKSKAAKPRALFQSTSVKLKEEALQNRLESTRSPLSIKNIDHSSPRMIVQRKQVNNIKARRFSNFDSTNKYEAFGDKENVSEVH